MSGPTSTAPTTTAPAAAAPNSRTTSTRSSTATTSSPNKLVKCIKAPYRVLLRARDLYVTCFTGCAGKTQGTVRAVSRAPRGYSFQSQATSGEDDIRELIRAASRGSIGASPGRSPAEGTKDGVVPRSQSVAIGRIDEDQPCEFADDVKVMGLQGMYPRSRSCAVVSKRKVGFMA